MTYDQYCVFCAPDSPSVPFGDPALWLFDSMRMACYFLAALHVVLLGRVLRFATQPGQRSRFVAQTLFTIVAVGTEIDHLGDYANYRLFLNVTALAFSAYGLLKFFNDRPRVRTPP